MTTSRQVVTAVRQSCDGGDSEGPACDTTCDHKSSLTRCRTDLLVGVEPRGGEVPLQVDGQHGNAQDGLGHPHLHRAAGNEGTNYVSTSGVAGWAGHEHETEREQGGESAGPPGEPRCAWWSMRAGQAKGACAGRSPAAHSNAGQGKQGREQCICRP